ncbi:hypothetical protein NM208_g12776 [Fusarium decemcellulare]|uniref:Uncharacterized protein n=1 Tax=Fusarium decemcellulare TaxID=57161 RepID=A0ACC1RP65_9HYPO|nr:hypothetical protein NM208_g12776 [Fusarium decemcellulare]
MTILTDNPGQSKAYLITFALGIFVHVAGFRRGEWDLYTAKLIVALPTVIAAGTYLLATASDHGHGSYLEAFKTASTYSFVFIAGITSSILVYRAFFHKLNHFPGPFTARLSNFYITARAVRKMHLFEEIQNLHKQYGDFVRTGPSEISITNPKAMQILNSSNSPCAKGPWYNIIHPMVSLQTDRDKKSHAQRRKAWDKAFTLRDYEHRVVQYTDQLLDRIAKTLGKPLNITEWFHFYTLDILGDLAFGQSFGMLKDGVKHYYMELCEQNMVLIGAFSHLVWLFPIFKSAPGINYAYIKFQKWLRAQVEWRRRNKPAVSDVFSWILEDFNTNENPTEQDVLNLYGDANLIVVAGSDTTAATLTCLFFELCQHPDVCSQLQTEIDEYIKEHGKADHASLYQLKFLQACVDETLRLHPVVPSGLQRVTPPEGLQIDDTFIPGNTIVKAPSYTMYRDERAFVQPLEFIPERWTSKPELIKDSSAYAPFSIGRYSCVGKQLGLMEIRYVVTEILTRYTFELAPNTDTKKFLDGKQDCFTLALADLNVIFTART